MLSCRAPSAFRSAAAAAARLRPVASALGKPSEHRGFAKGARPICLSDYDNKKLVVRGQDVKVDPSFWEYVADEKSVKDAPFYQNNTENYVGTVKYPVGVIGPLKVNGEFAKREYIVPMATHEGALLASYDRGAKAITQAGGVTARIKSRGMLRAPVFIFQSIAEAAEFRRFAVATETKEKLSAAIEKEINHCQVNFVRVFQTDRKVHISIGIDSGDAAGQNKVTYAGDLVMQWMTDNYSGKIPEAYIEGGFNAGKRVSVVHTLLGKGHAVVADVIIPRDVVKKTLHTTPYNLARFQKMHNRTNQFMGGISCTAHAANGLAAFYIATGNDPACTAESQAAVTHFNVSFPPDAKTKNIDEADLYASITMNSIIVANVGGGTTLPAFKAATSMMGIESSNELAEICAGVVLSGELSFYAAMESGEFTKAHWNMTHKK